MSHIKIRNRKQLFFFRSSEKYNYYVINVTNLLFYRCLKRYAKPWKLEKVIRGTVRFNLDLTDEEINKLVRDAQKINKDEMLLKN